MTSDFFLTLSLGAAIFLIPFSRFYWDPVSVLGLFLLSLLILNLFLFQSLFNGRALPALRRPYSLLGFTAFFLCSAFLSPFARAAAVETIFLFSAATLFAAAWASQIRVKQLLEKAVLAGAVTAALLYLAATISGGSVSAIDRTQLFVNDNVIASYLSAAVLVALGRVKNSGAYWGVIAVLLAALWVAQSALALLALGLALFLLNRKTRILPAENWSRAWTWGAGTVLTLAALLMILKSPWLADSFANRLRWWGDCLRLALESPWRGHGPGAFEQAGRMGGSLKSIYAHSFPLQEAVEAGFPALLCLVLLIRRLCFKRMEDPFLWAAALVLIAHGLLDFTLNIHGLFLFLFLLIALGSSPEVPRVLALTRARGAFIFSISLAVSAWAGWQTTQWLAKT